MSPLYKPAVTKQELLSLAEIALEAAEASTRCHVALYAAAMAYKDVGTTLAALLEEPPTR